MTPDDVKTFIGRLGKRGLLWLVNGEAEDIVVVDQLRGPTTTCRWITGGKHPHGYSAVWLAGTKPGNLAIPADWTPEVSRSMKFFATDQIEDKAIKLADAGGLEVWLDFDTGTERYVGRTRGPNEGKSH